MLKDEIDAKLLEETRGLVAKWDKTGLLDGLKDDLSPCSMSVLTECFGTFILEDGTRIVATSHEHAQEIQRKYSK